MIIVFIVYWELKYLQLVLVDACVRFVAVAAVLIFI